MPLPERGGDRGAPGGLRAEHPVRTVVDQPESDQLTKCLVDLNELRTGRYGDDDLGRQPPAQLLGDLVADGLGALGVVGPHVDVDEGPVLALVGQFGREPVHVVVAAIDGDQRAAVHGRGDDLLRLQVGRDQHHGADARAGRRRGHRVRQVAGGRAGQHLVAHLDRGREGDGDDAVLERVSRVAALILDPQGAAGRVRGPADRPGPGGSSPARCSAWRRHPGELAAGWRTARCWSAPPRCRPW